MNVKLRALTTMKDISFEPMGDLPQDFIPACMQLTNFCGKFLTFSGAKSYFNWLGFMLQVMVEINAKHDLTTDKMNMTRITQHSQSVQTLCSSISSWLGNNFSVKLDTGQLSAIIQNVFTNMKEVSNDSGFLSFDSERESANSAWEYRVFFALPDPNKPDRFHVLVSTIIIWADIVEKSAWWGLERWTEKNFGADIVGVVLGVEKGFKNPLA
ncbi:hypothetical protein AX16_002134 [Volvariella volvacea WC 439]|nr:hypothetical protein AX16_002134 [Volvariella volvacea WC 439]